MSFKLIKDPIYGYIEIDSEIIRSIIDTACFQRLRNIRQTSYAPLYPASLHNRFIHSIGVYHLGKMVFDIVDKYPLFDEAMSIKKLDIKRLFELACLLHDVGHAPFSHTGERFFLADAVSPPSIYAKLTEAVSDTDFSADFIYYYNNGKLAAPHEIMSCIVALDAFNDHFHNSSERSFFSRCITGFKYRQTEKANADILNCLIELLNSTVIDIDRLDYIIRDAKTTGFQSVSIDYERLLAGVRIIDNIDGSKCLAYHKSALSIIENVIYAHDAERKWIQNHPVILYEHFLLQHAMRNIDKYFSLSESGSRLFSLASLTRNGTDFGDKGKISLLADEDLLYIMKNVNSDDLIDEYFFRGSRRHPLWKSEAEYRALFDNELGKNKLDELEIAFKELEKYLIDNFSLPVINKSVLARIENEEREITDKKNTISEKDYKNLMDGIKKIKKWVNCLREIALANDMLFDFVIISANKFKSGFLKQDLEKILIYFPSLGLYSSIKEVSTILTSEKSRDSFFYLFYKSKDDNNDEDNDGKNKEAPVKAIAKTLAGELFV